ncbi:MAG: NifU family protein [Rhodospirillaceae bacterium]|jgi:Fe-S cluster biogenesis protein NfuA|nr:NifU family protein [Rhodospirillaceae bacterium]MBT3927089.1 NifU family protein [Rhodospirillaceae bacterium]MBT4428365.1 NifU family protein [Rhodospirillaceae bacterium]MBT5038826.1 NifU family protein [Rhodospirillaceae bacterium]MBT5677510.1 NifU family protein [Rhodospirillaceae bacterium]
MFIQTEQTPNPATLKFLPGQTVLAEGSIDIRDAEAAQCSPLAARLFLIDEVTGVFFGNEFVTITKTDDADWQMLKPVLLGVIMEHFVSGQPVMLDSADLGDGMTDDAVDGPDAEIIGQIKELLDTRVRPAVAQDGGDIVYRGFQNGVVMVQLQGACQGCPSSTATLKMGIENMLRHYIPEVVEVRAV